MSLRLRQTFLQPVRGTTGYKPQSSKNMNPGQCAGRKVLVDPEDDPHLQLVSVSSTEWISLNVGGVHFRTQRDTVANVPGSLLSELDEESPFYHAASGQYWFDRNPNLFQHILDLYRHGELHFPHSLCGPVIKRELDFWAIDESHIAACCWNSYREFREQEETLKTLGTAFNDIDRFKRREKKAGPFMQACFNFRERVWYFLEDPRSSIFAQIWAVLYVLMIVGSVLSLALDTHHTFRVTSENRTREVNESQKEYLMETTEPHPALYFTELVISTVFAINLIIRFIVCPRKLRFIKSPLNWIDVVVVLSQWAINTIAMLPDLESEGGRKIVEGAYNLFRLMRIFRVFLIFRLARHYTGLRILLLALRASMKELMLMGVFMTIGMMIFSTLIYYAEFARADEFPDIPTGFWWAIVTMTTVGYGDVHPQTAGGYAVGALCALSGMLATGLPIPIIANNFTFYYNVSKMKKMMDDREAISLSSEVLGTMKDIFRRGGNLVGMMSDKVSGVTHQITDKVTEAARRDKKSKDDSCSPENSEFDNSNLDEVVFNEGGAGIHAGAEEDSGRGTNPPSGNGQIIVSTDTPESVLKATPVYI